MTEGAKGPDGTPFRFSMEDMLEAVRRNSLPQGGDCSSYAADSEVAEGLSMVGDPRLTVRGSLAVMNALSGEGDGKE